MFSSSLKFNLKKFCVNCQYGSLSSLYMLIKKKKKKKARERKKIFFFHEQRNLGSLISYTLLSCSPVTPVPPFPPDARHSFGVLCHFSSLFPSSTHWAEVGELNSPIFLSQRKLRWLSPPSSIQVPVFMLFADNRYI